MENLSFHLSHVKILVSLECGMTRCEYFQDKENIFEVEDSHHALPPMTGGRNSVRGGVRDIDDRRGPLLPGESAWTGAL